MNIFGWIRLALGVFGAIKDPDKLQALILEQTENLDIAEDQKVLKAAVLDVRAIAKDDEAFEANYNLVAGIFASDLEDGKVGAWGDGTFFKAILDFMKTVDWSEIIEIIKIFTSDKEKVEAYLAAIERSENATELLCSAIESPSENAEWIEARAKAICAEADPEMDPFTIIAIINIAFQVIKFWRDRRNNQ